MTFGMEITSRVIPAAVKQTMKNEIEVASGRTRQKLQRFE